MFMIIFSGEWGVNFKDWILQQASAVALAAVVVTIIPMIWKKMWAGLIGTLCAAAIGLFFVNKPETLKSIGEIFYQIVFK